jgi:uncharacterized protein (DUF169 family)
MTPAQQLTDLLGLQRQPVAISFRETAAEGISRIDEPAVSGCTYWRYASEGRTFYTEAADHYGCPIGAHTHGVELSKEAAKELEGLVTTMVQLEYIDMAEVPGIPRRQEPFRRAVYAPLADAEFEPDVVMVSGNAKQLMLLAEAAHRAGIACESSMVGRPTCAVIPAVLASGNSAANLGCIGNRVYTGLADDQLYFAVAGHHLDRLIEKLQVIVNANRELEAFHLARVS